MSKLLERLVNAPRSLLQGLRVTITNMVRTKATKLYPEVLPVPTGRHQGEVDPTDPFSTPYTIAPRYRGLHGLTRDPVSGDLNCIGCMACANVCPDKLIAMDLEKREGHSGRYPVTFTVDIGPCCFCGLCSEVCPTPMRSIVMTDVFEFAAYRRDGATFVLDREALLRNGDWEAARRREGRQWSADGELQAVLPEEEGNPYFQFAPESGKDKAKKAAAEVPAEGEPAAVDHVKAVREAFAAAGLPCPEDLEAFDQESLKAISDRQVYAKVKSTLIKALRAGVKRIPADPVALLPGLFAQAGIPVPEDLAAFDLSVLSALEDRQLYAKLKSSIIKALRAGVTSLPAQAE
jgi:NADH-quinone oxidoreductase subunit I